MPNIDLSPTILTDKSGVIEYSSGNKLTYNKNGYGSVFDYEYESGKIRFNDIAPEWDFLPVKSAFYAKLEDDEMLLKRPQVHFNIPELSKDEIYILAALHEIGHANLYDRSYNDLKEYNEFDYSSSYTYRLKITNDILKSKHGIKRLSIMSERGAWAFALNMIRKRKMLTKERKRIRDFYRSKLSTYGIEYL